MKNGYQVVLVDLRDGSFRPANGNGITAHLWWNYDDARTELKERWTRMFHPDSNYRLGVQKLSIELMPGSLVGVDGDPVPLTDEEKAEVGDWQI